MNQTAKQISPQDRAIWDELDDMSKHMLDPTIPWQPATPAEQGFADLIEAGELVDSGGRRPRRDGKLSIVWIASVFRQ
jgi:hypothetical protein